MKQVLLLGSGFVAKPAIDHLLTQGDIHITIVSLFQNELDGIVSSFGSKNLTTVQLDIANKMEEIEKFLPNVQVCISLIPATLHASVAKLCIKHKVNFLSASYISPDIAELDKEAKEAGVLLLNELGLDPGIDHMSAMKIIDSAKQNNGKITSFISWCGALPSLECSDNPFGYKFSWSPRGVLASSLLPAIFLWDQHIDQVPAELKFAALQPIVIEHEGQKYEFEGIPNRDSLSYINNYSLNKDDLTTMFRGTLRWKGFGIMVRALAAIGLFNASQDAKLATADLFWRSYLVSSLGCNDNDDDLLYCLKSTITDAFKAQEKLVAESNYHFPIIPRDTDKDVEYAINGLKWLGIVANDEKVVNRGTPIDSLCALLEKKLSYQKDERDIVVLTHQFVVEYPAENKKEQETSSLVCFGIKGGSSATSLTVGYPVGIAADLVLQGCFKTTGVVGPVTPEFYNPLLELLKQEKIEMVETKKSL
ncbi:hypothetical protein CYY_007199 [Polysphondylium violaceum]|uniref:Saccharopine dehydrogenase n=1 Tax=Polysphondylium violaceum TaxID=133409 RepID=A0A8J4PQ11_9MYCE|nr:hypothetical protein CYY_007199 [Polysphondylium violaceum]